VVALVAVAVVLDTVFTAALRPLLSEATWADHGWPLVPVASVVYAVMGAIIVSRYPRHPLGWLLSAASLLSVTLAAEAYSAWVLEGGGPGSAYGAHVTAWAAPLLGWPAFTAIVLVFFTAPDGHLLSPRWRWPVRATIAGLALHTLGTLTARPADFVQGGQYDNGDLSTVLLTVGWVLVAAGLVASAVSLVIRLQRARDDERRQLLWIASSAAFLAVGVLVVLVVPRVQDGELTWLAALPLRLAHLAVPLCVAVAVLRHRLFDIELIVNRALVVALSAAVVGAAYVAVVVALGAAAGAGGFWTSLAATAMVAMAFQPLRRRVVRLADRLAFGAAAVPHEALADLSRRLGDSPDPAELLPAVAQAAGSAVGARQVSVRLLVADGSDHVATWRDGEGNRRKHRNADEHGPVVQVRVVHLGDLLGTVDVVMPAGRALRAGEHRLLQDLADHAAPAFSATRLQSELTQQVHRLDVRTLQLAASRRRLISTGDAERSRLERSIARRVLPHLVPLPARLDNLASGLPQQDGSQLAAPLAATLAALEELREITRGVFPAQLARSGLQPALASLLARTHHGTLVVDPAAHGLRLAPSVEAAAYFCVAEVLPTLPPPVQVSLAAADDQLTITVTGDGPTSVNLDNLRDRVEAADGWIVVRTDRDGTRLELTVPAGQGMQVSG
jgi:hypothetical protein